MTLLCFAVFFFCFASGRRAPWRLPPFSLFFTRRRFLSLPHITERLRESVVFAHLPHCRAALFFSSTIFFSNPPAPPFFFTSGHTRRRLVQIQKSVLHQKRAPFFSSVRVFFFVWGRARTKKDKHPSQPFSFLSRPPPHSQTPAMPALATGMRAPALAPPRRPAAVRRAPLNGEEEEKGGVGVARPPLQRPLTVAARLRKTSALFCAELYGCSGQEACVCRGGRGKRNSAEAEALRWLGLSAPGDALPLPSHAPKRALWLWHAGCVGR